MATLYSAQAKKMFGQSSAGLYEAAKGSEARGKVRTMIFDVLDLVVIAQNDDVILGTLPKGYRVLYGHMWHEDFGATVTMDIGVYTRDISNTLTLVDIDLFGDGLDIAAAGEKNLANTKALGMLAAAATDEHVVVARFLVANPTDSKKFAGYLKYIAPDS